MPTARCAAFLAALVLALVLAGVAAAQGQADAYRVARQYPHDPGAFTQGLIFDNGALYESTGLNGASSLRKVELSTGTVTKKLSVPAQFFAEGLTLFQGKLYQLTWQSQVGFIYDPETFAQIGQFSYAGEGWGLTHDGQKLIMSDGTHQIRFLDPATFQTVRTIDVRDANGNPLTRLNELEYIDGQIFANVWQTNLIVRIDPATGRLLGSLDLTGLLPAGISADVLNGIAYDPGTRHLLVTGKFWPYLYELELVSTPPPRPANLALAANGAVVRASSTYGPGYPPSGVIDGDRAGNAWGAGGGWNDATPDALPDWIEVEFPSVRTVRQIDVFGVQDTYWAPTEPTPATTFTRFGLVDFDVEYWTASGWALVAGGSVQENRRVWRTFTFDPITTSRIRVLVKRGADAWSRVTEIEAYETATEAPSVGPGTNVALAARGGVARASSSHSAAYSPWGAIDGDRAGVNWGVSGGWNDGTPNAFPDWLEVEFATAYAITQINVFTVQDAYYAPTQPTSAMTFTQYGVRDFDVQYWNGTSWLNVSGASVTGNNLVWRNFTFAAIVTTRIRVQVHGGADQWSRITEIEALTGDASAPPAPPTGTNVARASNGALAFASSTHSDAYPPSGVIDGDRAGRGWGAGGGWNDATSNSFPDWLEIEFARAFTIGQINVFTVQDAYSAPVEPTGAMTFSLYGIRAFNAEYWDDDTWKAVPDGAVRDNDLVWRTLTFPPLTTSKIRIVITDALATYSRITEIEALTP